jgi:uncharacterized protein (TIGR03435 family)
LKQSLLKLSVLLPLASLAAFAQPPAAPLAFEVATIKPAEPITAAMVQAGKMHVGLNVDAARVDIGFMSLSDLIVTAYKVKPYQVEGPDWMKVQRFDVLATMPPGATKDDVPGMLQGLLKDRFKVEIHRDKKDHSVFALVVAKGGIKMKEAEPDIPAKDGEPAPLAKGEVQMGSGDNAVRMKQSSDGRSGVATSAKTGPVKYSVSPEGMIHYEYGALDMNNLCDALSQFVGTPVLDMTDLKGKYQLALDFSMQDMMAVARRAGVDIPAGAPGTAPAGEASDPGSSSLFGAVQRLGLKLETRKAPVDLIVVDRAEKMPTEN